MSIFPGMTQGLETPGNTLTNVVVNGEPRALAGSATVADLLRSLSLEPRLVVVERNREILRDRGTFDSIELAEGDQIEIVHFVGGG